MKRILQCLVCGCGSSARACVLDLLAEVGGTDFWRSIVKFARASSTELDHLGRANFLYTIQVCSQRKNSVIVITTCTMHCRIGMNLYGIVTTPEMV